MRRPFLIASAVMLLAACTASLTLVSFQITRDGDEDPFPGATGVVISVRQDGVLLPRSAERTSLTEASFTTPTVPFGAGYTLRVDVMDGALLLARGTSTQFEARSAGDESLPDVFVAPLGRFALLAPRSHAVPVAAASSGEVVILGNGDGSITALDLRDTSTSDRVPAAATRRFVALPGGLLGIDGDEAHFVDDEVHTTTDASLERHGADALLVPVLPGDSDEPCAFVLGGRADPRAFTQLCVSGGVLTVTELADLGVGGWAGAGALVTLEGGQRRIAWVSRQDAGGASTALALVNPEAPEVISGALLNLPTSGASVLAHGTGELLVLGGRSQGGVVLADVKRIVVRTSGSMPAVEVSPAPDPLFSPRQGGAVSWVADGIYLIYGGTDQSGTRVLRPELVDVRNLPGAVAPTGELPTTAPLVVLPIDDHAQLAVGAAGVWRYASPRGFE